MKILIGFHKIVARKSKLGCDNLVSQRIDIESKIDYLKEYFLRLELN